MAILQQGSIIREVVTDGAVTRQHRNGKESFMLAFAIDKQNHGNAGIHSLGDTIKQGCKYITGIFVAKKLIDENSVKVFQSSTNPDECSKKRIQQQIRKCTSNVGGNGLFVLYLSGHGESHGFLPGDYSAGERNSISANLLSNCLASAWSSIGNILVILDCCKAGMLAKTLAKLVPRNVWILSACTGSETTLTCKPLGCSIFTYLVGRAINNIPDSFEVSETSLNAIHKSCTASVKALTALSSDELLYYESGLEQGRRRVDTDGHDSVVNEWLKEKNQHITILVKERAFEDERLCGKEKRVLKIALSLMMYSVARLKLNSQKGKQISPNPDIYLCAFNEAVNVFCHNFKFELEITSELRLQCLEFYWENVRKALLNQQMLIEEIEKCYKEFRASLRDQGYETDKSIVSVCIKVIHLIIM